MKVCRDRAWRALKWHFGSRCKQLGSRPAIGRLVDKTGKGLAVNEAAGNDLGDFEQ